MIYHTFQRHTKQNDAFPSIWLPTVQQQLCVRVPGCVTRQAPQEEVPLRWIIGHIHSGTEKGVCVYVWIRCPVEQAIDDQSQRAW